MESSPACADVANGTIENLCNAVVSNANQVQVSPVPDLVAGSSPTAAVPEPQPVKIDSGAESNKTSSTTLNQTENVKSVKGAPAPTRASSVPSAASEASIKNRNRDEKSRKKDDKSVDHVLRALNSLNTPEEKLAAMCKKYTDTFDEHRKLQLQHKQSEKRVSMLQREKEQLQAEHSKAILTRSRLENLCRELQRQNKAIKDESLLRIREEEEKRKEVSAKFQTTMNEITALMQQNNDKNLKLRDDNIDMTTKLKNICEQYELRQQQVERISKQMQLEQQLADAKLSKLKMEMSAEREMLLREKQQLLMELQQYQQRCTESQATEVNLRNQISMYNDKYDEFQKALARSNDVFGGFKGEMEKMSKKICKLEKETSSWKQRWERSHNALLEMAADKQRSEQELGVVSRQLATLQGLCRTLQTERATLLAKLKLFQAGGPDSLEKVPSDKCPKQCENISKPVSESNPVMDSYTKDILASFNDSSTPLPDVVGVSEVNGGLCQRLDNISLVSPNPSTIQNDLRSDQHIDILNQVNGDSIPNGLPPDFTSNLVSTTESAKDPVSMIEALNVSPPSSIAESKSDLSLASSVESSVPAAEELVGVAQPMNNEPPAAPTLEAPVTSTTETNIVSPTADSTEPPPSTPQPPKSPIAKGSPTKSTDNAKKSKETNKKRKK